MRKALVILSGGQDSTTCLFWALQVYTEVHAITFDYGQRHVSEIDAAKKVAQMAGVASHEIVTLPAGILAGASPLTDSTKELEKYESAEQMAKVIGDRRELTFVPMRNALFITIAANRAEVLAMADRSTSVDIVLGICQMDNANYDDCREVFLQSAQSTMNTALGHDHRGTPSLTLTAPLLYMTKAQTVQLAYDLGPEAVEALAYTMTSYDGNYPPTDMNHANVLRAEGFEQAGLPDPLVLRAVAEGLMQLPDSANYQIVETQEEAGEEEPGPAAD